MKVGQERLTEQMLEHLKAIYGLQKEASQSKCLITGDTMDLDGPTMLQWCKEIAPHIEFFPAVGWLGHNIVLQLVDPEQRGSFLRAWRAA